MVRKLLRIGTRESQLAVWQATKVKVLLAENSYESELVFIKSEGDIDLQTPLYEMGVQGIFTRSLDIALLNNRIDIAVHSLKDVHTQLQKGIIQSAVLKRASHKDLLVVKESEWELVNSHFEHLHQKTRNEELETRNSFTIATSSIRRKARQSNR